MLKKKITRLFFCFFFLEYSIQPRKQKMDKNRSCECNKEAMLRHLREKISSDMNNDKNRNSPRVNFLANCSKNKILCFVGNVPNERLTYQVGDGKIGAYQADNG